MNQFIKEIEQKSEEILREYHDDNMIRSAIYLTKAAECLRAYERSILTKGGLPFSENRSGEMTPCNKDYLKHIEGLFVNAK